MSTLNKNQIIAIIDSLFVKNGFTDEDQLELNVFTREEAFQNEVDDYEFCFTEGKEVDFYILYSDNPDYCFIYPEMTIEGAENAINSWFYEVGIIK